MDTLDIGERRQQPRLTSDQQKESHIKGLKGYYLGIAQDLISGNMTPAQFSDSLTEKQLGWEVVATRDLLTGLLNRKGFEEQVVPYMQEGGTLIVMDLDDFKALNDVFGHLTGDMVLEKMGEILNPLKSTRWGGEEFCVYLSPEEVSHGLEEFVANLGSDITKRIAETPGTTPKDLKTLLVTVSMGVAYVEPGEDFKDTFKRADDLMYKAKRVGDGEQPTLAKRRAVMEAGRGRRGEVIKIPFTNTWD